MKVKVSFSRNTKENIDKGFDKEKREEVKKANFESKSY